MIDKINLRQDLRKIRQSFVKARQSPSLILHDETRASLDTLISRAQMAAGYLPVGSEVDLRDVMTSYAQNGTKWCFPWLSAREAPMLFRVWTPGDATETAPGGFEQPLSSSSIAEPDLILLPLLGFDRNGNRLGQGAGHYDRALEALPAALRIGIGWSVQEVDHVPADPWDVPLDAILTEAEWILPPSSRLIGN